MLWTVILIILFINGKGSFHWNVSHLTWYCYKLSISARGVGMGFEVHVRDTVTQGRWHNAVIQPGANKRESQEETSYELAWGEILLHFLYFDIVIFLWQTEALLISCYVGQPCVSCALESKSVGKQPKRVVVVWIVLKRLLAVKPRTEVRSQRWKTTIRTYKQLLGMLWNSFKGPGHTGVIQIGVSDLCYLFTKGKCYPGGQTTW